MICEKKHSVYSAAPNREYEQFMDRPFDFYGDWGEGQGDVMRAWIIFSSAT